jgi:hypothetical protein
VPPRNDDILYKYLWMNLINAHYLQVISEIITLKLFLKIKKPFRKPLGKAFLLRGPFLI